MGQDTASLMDVTRRSKHPIFEKPQTTPTPDSMSKITLSSYLLLTTSEISPAVGYIQDNKKPTFSQSSAITTLLYNPSTLPQYSSYTDTTET